MRKPLHRAINFGNAFVVRKKFRSGGRLFSPGDPFNWKKIGVERRRVIQLFETGYIGNISREPEPDPILEVEEVETEVEVTPEIPIEIPEEQQGVYNEGQDEALHKLMQFVHDSQE